MATITRIEYTAHDEETDRWYDGKAVYLFVLLIVVGFILAL